MISDAKSINNEVKPIVVTTEWGLFGEGIHLNIRLRVAVAGYFSAYGHQEESHKQDCLRFTH